MLSNASKIRRQRSGARPPKELLRLVKSGRAPVFVVSAYVNGQWVAKETASAKHRAEAVAHMREVLIANGFEETGMSLPVVRL